MNILLIGGYGFIGQHAAQRFNKEGCTLTIIDRDVNKQKKELKIKHTSYQLDTKDKRCEEIFKSGHFDTVVFLEEADVGIQSTYVDGFINILNYAAKYKVKSFVFLSERTFLEAEDAAHAMGRKMIEEYCRNASELQEMHCIGLRVWQVYGPNQHLSQRKNEADEIINNALKGETLAAISEHPEYLLYVEDAVDAVYKAISFKGNGIFDLQPPNKATAEALGWRPKYSLEEGLRKTFNWYKLAGDMVIETEAASSNSFKITSILPYLENIMFFLIVFLIHYNTRDNLDRYSVFPMDLNVIYIFIISIIYGMKQGFFAALLASISYVYVYLSVSPDIAGILYNKGHIIQLLIYLVVAIVSSFAIDNKKREIINLKGNLKILKDEFDYMQNVYEDTVTVKNELHAQILNADNSIGTIYSLTKELNSLLVEDLFNGAVSILEKLLKTKMISIYTVNQNMSFLRLVAKSRKLGQEVSNSIDIDKNPAIKEIILRKEIFINRELIPDLPVMLAPIVFGNEVIAVIFVHETAFENLTLYYENFFKVSIELIASAFSQALNYEKAIYADKYIPETRIMNAEYFQKIIESKNKAKASFDIEYTILKVNAHGHEAAAGNQQDQLMKLSQIIESHTRETDYIGLDDKAQLYIILSNSNNAMSTIVAQRLEKSGLSVAVCSKVGK